MEGNNGKLIPEQRVGDGTKVEILVPDVTVHFLRLLTTEFRGCEAVERRRTLIMTDFDLGSTGCPQFIDPAITKLRDGYNLKDHIEPREFQAKWPLAITKTNDDVQAWFEQQLRSARAQNADEPYSEFQSRLRMQFRDKMLSAILDLDFANYDEHIDAVEGEINLWYEDCAAVLGHDALARLLGAGDNHFRYFAYLVRRKNPPTWLVTDKRVRRCLRRAVCDYKRIPPILKAVNMRLLGHTNGTEWPICRPATIGIKTPAYLSEDNCAGVLLFETKKIKGMFVDYSWEAEEGDITGPLLWMAKQWCAVASEVESKLTGKTWKAFDEWDKTLFSPPS